MYKVQVEPEIQKIFIVNDILKFCSGLVILKLCAGTDIFQLFPSLTF